MKTTIPIDPHTPVPTPCYEKLVVEYDDGRVTFRLESSDVLGDNSPSDCIQYADGRLSDCDLMLTTQSILRVVNNWLANVRHEEARDEAIEPDGHKAACHFGKGSE